MAGAERGRPAVDPVVRRLRELARVTPALARAAGVHEALLPVLRDARLAVRPVRLERAEALAKLGRGEPLLAGLEPELDLATARDLAHRLARALEGPARRSRRRTAGETADPAADKARLVREALAAGKVDVGALLARTAAGERGFVVEASRGPGLDPGVLGTIAETVLKTALRAWCRQVAPLAAGADWLRPSCPVCGAPSSLAELQGPVRERHLRCCRCGAGWRIPRLRCPHCGGEEHAAQLLLHLEGKRETERAEVCEACRCYVKVVAAHEPTAPELLPALDLLTFHLDAAAQARGYRPGLRASS